MNQHEGGGEGQGGEREDLWSIPRPGEDRGGLSIGVGVNYYAHRQEMSAEACVVIN